MTFPLILRTQLRKQWRLRIKDDHWSIVFSQLQELYLLRCFVTLTILTILLELLRMRYYNFVSLCAVLLLDCFYLIRVLSLYMQCVYDIIAMSGSFLNTERTRYSGSTDQMYHLRLWPGTNTLSKQMVRGSTSLDLLLYSFSPSELSSSR